MNSKDIFTRSSKRECMGGGVSTVMIPNMVHSMQHV